MVFVIKCKETVNRFLQQQSQKDEVEGPTGKSTALDGCHD